MNNGVIIDGVRYAFVEFSNPPDDPLKFCDHCDLQKICWSFSEDAPCHIFREYVGKLFVRVNDVPNRLEF